MFSAYWLDPSYGWIAAHRLPLASAIVYCKECRRNQLDCPVAIVPDGADPAPYLRLAEGVNGQGDECYDANGEWLPMGRCDSCGAPCDPFGCTRDREHIVAVALA